MKTRTFSLVVGLVLALAFAGCGGDGISEKQLYFEVAAAEDRGELEARKEANGCIRGGLDLDVDKYASIVGPLLERYRNEVLAQYGVSQEQWTEIVIKGSRERWEVPEPLKCE